VARVSEILRGKGGDVLKIDGSATVFEAITKIVELNVGSILVTEGDKVVGIMTERDYLRKIAVHGRTSRAPGCRGSSVPAPRSFAGSRAPS